MIKRWISLYVENDVGVLARVSGLFSGKSYNLNSLTVGETQDPRTSRMTIGFTSDDATFAQVIKQLGNCVEVLRVVDLSGRAIHKKELLYVKLNSCTGVERSGIAAMAQGPGCTILQQTADAILLEFLQDERQNDAFLARITPQFDHRMEVVRGGSVAIEALDPA